MLLYKEHISRKCVILSSSNFSQVYKHRKILNKDNNNKQNIEWTHVHFNDIIKQLSLK